MRCGCWFTNGNKCTFLVQNVNTERLHTCGTSPYLLKFAEVLCGFLVCWLSSSVKLCFFFQCTYSEKCLVYWLTCLHPSLEYLGLMPSFSSLSVQILGGSHVSPSKLGPCHLYKRQMRFWLPVAALYIKRVN